MDKKEVNEDKISKNFIFFDFRDFSFHNYGQMFPKWNIDKPRNAKEKKDDTSLNCSPDTDAAIQDALEEIIRDLSGEKIEESDIKLFDDADNNFNKFTSHLSETKEIEEYGKYIKNNIKNFASKKHKESDELCNKVFKSLFTPANFHEFQENITGSITDFLKIERITDNDTNKKKYILKYLNILLRTIPQPWNALASGAILTFIMKLAQDSKVIGKQDNEFIEYMHPVIYIKDTWNYIKKMSNIKNSGNELPSEYADIVKDIQFYLEYALIMNAPDEWKPTGPKIDNAPPSQVSMIAFPLLDNGFFRGYFYLLSSCPDQIRAQCEPNILKQYEKKCLYFVDSLRVAHETEMMDILFREKKGGDDGTEDKAERDIYKRILKNLNYIQEVSLGSLWMIDGEKITQSYVTGYGRYFKGKPKEDGTPGIYWYREYKSYENFINTKRNITTLGKRNIKNKEKKLANIVNNLYRTNREDFQREYPKYEVLDDDFNSQYIQPSSAGSYYKQETLGIKWRLTLPVVRGDNLKAIYFFYYRDPIVISNGKYTNLSKIEGNILQKEIFGLRAKQIMKFFSAIEAYEERKSEIIKHGTRAAVAAIMGRNMSHNIGSHVLSYLSNENEDKDEDKSKGKFYRYLQGRMDFIADISTTKPSWSSNVNFIEEILNPFVGVELQKPNVQVLPEQAKLLNNILRSVAINHNNERICLDAKKIIIRVSHPAQTINMTDQQLTYKYFSSSGKVGLKGTLQEDFLLTIPHGSTGMHAFYSILENFLRNSGKHGGEGVNEILRDSKSTLECFIYVQWYDENLYKVTIRDNIKKDFPDKTISEINEYITGKHSTLINDDGSINQEGWGIKEMRISAAWLRGIEPKEVQNPFISPPLLNPIKTDVGGIGYEFYLLKPLEVLIVTNDSNIKENRSKGIYIKKTTKELDDLIKNGGLRHKFIVFDSPDENIGKWIREHSLSLPFSTFCVSPQFDYHFLIDKDSLLNGDITNNLYKALRKYITSKIDIQEEIKLAILEDALQPLSSIRNYILESNPDKVSSECIVFQHDFEGKKAYICGKNPLYYQEYSSVQRTGRRLRSLLEKEGEIGIHKIYISALSKIVIADERLFSKEMSKNSLEEWERMGIEIVDIKRSNNDVIVYKKDTKSSEAWNVYISKNKQTIFFSIHQAIIKDEIKEDIWNKMVEDLTRNKVFVLIHSGRGGVNITKGFKFVELTNIENMIDNRDKIGLTELFFHYVRGRQND